MAHVIAGIYEIEKQIGSGGGGIVYLGRHLRLEKQIVLKADKRTINTKSDALRREVNMLKGISHQYIPQVYDFVQQDGVVYTVMDYIEGESLDKILARGDIPSQPQVIGWACQLLEALSYLHSRPPHGILHGDIKPANIMLRPDGDICLIDYNIALALGEDGAVKVGRSRGYASPEHYGMEFSENLTSGSAITKAGKSRELAETETMYMAGDATETMAVRPSKQLSGTRSTSSHPAVMLDVRSDIYSLGATLYHLLSGKRPVQNALEVEPLGADICSAAVAAIIQKAMSPSQEMRYQSAEEMLTAFRRLHKNDRRMIAHKRWGRFLTVILSAVFLAGGFSAFTGLRQLEQLQTSLTLAEYSANRLAQGDVTGAVSQAMAAMPEENGIFKVQETAQAQKALTDALGVYDLSDGFKDIYTAELPSAPLKTVLSPKGTWLAAVYSGEAAVFDIESGENKMKLPVQDSALSDFIFIDEKQAVYAGDQGVTALNLETGNTIWTGEEAVTLAVSGDGTVIAAANTREDRAVIYRLSDGEKMMERSFDGRYLPAAYNDIFADPDNSIFSLNQDGSMLAASFSDGALWICDLENPDNDMILYEESDYVRFSGGFCGKYFAFTADKNGQSLFGMVDTERAVYIGGYEAKENFGLFVNEKGICLSNENLVVRFDPETLEETELAYTSDAAVTGFSVGEEYVLTATEDKKIAFFDKGANQISWEQCSQICDFVNLSGRYAVIGNRSEPVLRIMKLESHSETQLLTYDARYPHDEARISKDGQTAMLFNYENFRIYDLDGNMTAEIELPDPERIYDQQFRKEEGGSWLEVIWYDGTRRCYDASDGSLRSETKGQPPEKDLYEEFYTEQYRIASSLHSPPVAYDLETGRKIKELEKDDYLTYVTQEGDYIITEYVSASGERYGLLLNSCLETLAVLPGLCDVQDGMAVFDYHSGNLRQCRLYSLQELKAFGEIYLKENGGKGVMEQ